MMRQFMRDPSILYSLMESVILAFLLTLFVTGGFAFLGFVFTTSKLLPEQYYTIKRPKKLKRIYHKLGVRHFRLIIVLAFWGNTKNKKRFFDGTRSGLKHLVVMSKQAEFGHFAAFWLIFLLSILLLWKGYYLIAVIANLINVIGNLYPVILQRHHRMRLDRLLAK